HPGPAPKPRGHTLAAPRAAVDVDPGMCPRAASTDKGLGRSHYPGGLEVRRRLDAVRRRRYERGSRDPRREGPVSLRRDDVALAAAVMARPRSRVAPRPLCDCSDDGF